MAKEDVTTRERLVEAALAEIVERGWGGVRSRGVAGRAGVNNALVHYHFGSMDNLRLEAAGAAFARLGEAFGPAWAQAPTVAEGIAAMATRLAAVDTADPIWQVLMEVFVQAPRDPRLAGMARAALESYRESLRPGIAAAVARGDLPDGTDVAGLAVALTAMLDGLGLHAWVDPDIDTRRAGAAVAALLHRSGEEAT